MFEVQERKQKRKQKRRRERGKNRMGMKRMKRMKSEQTWNGHYM